MLIYSATASGVADRGDDFRRVRNLLQQSRFEEATQELNALLQQSNLSSQERFDAGWMYGQAHEFRKALAVIRSVPETFPDRITHDYAAALAAVELKEFGTAVQLLEPLVDQSGFGSRQANLLGVAYTKTAQFDKAYRLFNKQVQSQPEDSRLTST